MDNRLGNALATGYALGVPVTFLWLTFFDGYAYNGWNWLVAVPVNAFMGVIWPVYWLLLRWLF